MLQRGLLRCLEILYFKFTTLKKQGKINSNKLKKMMLLITFSGQL